MGTEVEIEKILTKADRLNFMDAKMTNLLGNVMLMAMELLCERAAEAPEGVAEQIESVKNLVKMAIVLRNNGLRLTSGCVLKVALFTFIEASGGENAQRMAMTEMVKFALPSDAEVAVVDIEKILSKIIKDENEDEDEFKKAYVN